MTDFTLGGDQRLPVGWSYAIAGSFRRKRSVTFNPAIAAEACYELYSVPSHAIREPEVVSVAEIGSNKQYVGPGDVLISKINPRLNRTWVVGNKEAHEQIASTEWIVFPRSDAIDSRYLALLLSDLRIRDFLAANSSGVGGSLTRVRPNLFDVIRIPIPPTCEQRRIVEKIELLFDEFDRGVESLRAAKAALDLYRKSLLKSAFEGRLTADWRARNPDKLESPETLLARIREERERHYQGALGDWKKSLTEWRTNGGKGKKPTKPKHPRQLHTIPTGADMGPAGWTFVPLGILIDYPSYGTSKKCEYDTGNKGVLRIPNIDCPEIDATDLKFADFDKAEIEQYRLIEGDVLTVRSNGSLTIVGKPALVSARDTQFLFAGYLIRLRPIAGSLVSKILVYLMNEPIVRAQIESKAKSTSGVNNISAKELQELSVPICSQAEQAEIVHLLDSSLEAAAYLETEIEGALLRVDLLRQSILKKAFAGQLVPQDPGDQPAKALLETLKAAPTQSKHKNRKRLAPA